MVQLVADLANETHTTANYIHMVISLEYVTTIIFKEIHSSNEFVTPYSTTNNALKVKAYTITL